MALWMVRAGKYGFHEELLLEQGIIATGMEGLPDLSGIRSRDEIKEILSGINPEDSIHRIANYAGQFWSFVSKMKTGDLVMLPQKTKVFAVGRITGGYKYREDLPTEIKHTRAVGWLEKEIPRSSLGDDLTFFWGAFMTGQLKRNNAEERILAVLDGNPDPYLNSDITKELEGDVVVDEWIPPFDLEQYSMDQIRSYIGKRFKGHELSRLITELLKAQGYQTRMSPPGPDGGVDILAGRGPMGFDNPRLCVQVKSGVDSVNINPIRELQGIMKNFGAEQGLFVSWSGFKSSVYRDASKLFFEIRLWDADDVVKSLMKNFDNLPEDIQAEIPLKRIWTLVMDE